MFRSHPLASKLGVLAGVAGGLAALAGGVGLYFALRGTGGAAWNYVAAGAFAGALAAGAVRIRTRHDTRAAAALLGLAFLLALALAPNRGLVLAVAAAQTIVAGAALALLRGRPPVSEGPPRATDESSRRTRFPPGS